MPLPKKARERMSKKEKNCLNCRIHWDREGGCEVCRWEDEDHPTLFYQITRSPEVLAENVTYTYEMAIGGSMFRVYWTSPFVENFYINKAEAIAATVAKLKEVCDDTK